MSKKGSKHIKKNNSKSYKKIAFVVILILIIVICIKKSTKEKQYSTLQIVINNQNITSELQNEVIKKDEKIYMSFEDIKNFLDSTIYKEENTDLIITTSNKKIATFKQGENELYINGSKQDEKDLVIEKDGKDYIDISKLGNVYDYDFNYIASSNIVTIDNLNKKIVKAYTTKTLHVKEDNKIFSKTVETVQKGNWIIFISYEKGVAQVRTQNGRIGYVKEKYLNNFVTEREDLNETVNNMVTDKEAEYDITKKDIKTFEKRKNIIESILQEIIKNDKMYVKIIYNGSDELSFERFKIEIVPMLSECGIKVEF